MKSIFLTILIAGATLAAPLTDVATAVAPSEQRADVGVAAYATTASAPASSMVQLASDGLRPYVVEDMTATHTLAAADPDIIVSGFFLAFFLFFISKFIGFLVKRARKRRAVVKRPLQLITREKADRLGFCMRLFDEVIPASDGRFIVHTKHFIVHTKQFYIESPASGKAARAKHDTSDEHFMRFIAAPYYRRFFPHVPDILAFTYRICLRENFPGGSVVVRFPLVTSRDKLDGARLWKPSVFSRTHYYQPLPTKYQLLSTSAVGPTDSAAPLSSQQAASSSSAETPPSEERQAIYKRQVRAMQQKCEELTAMIAKKDVELKAANVERKAANAELKAANAEVKAAHADIAAAMRRADGHGDKDPRKSPEYHSLSVTCKELKDKCAAFESQLSEVETGLVKLRGELSVPPFAPAPLASSLSPMKEALEQLWQTANGKADAKTASKEASGLPNFSEIRSSADRLKDLQALVNELYDTWQSNLQHLDNEEAKLSKQVEGYYRSRLSSADRALTRLQTIVHRKS